MGKIIDMIYLSVGITLMIVGAYRMLGDAVLLGGGVLLIVLSLLPPKSRENK